MIYKLNILVVGDFIYPIYEQAFYNKFTEIGHYTEKFEISKYLSITNKNSILRNYYKVQYKFNLGLSIIKLNNELLKKVADFEPDFIFVYRGKHISPKTLLQIKQKYPNIKLFNYNNDDAFSEKYPSYFWNLYKKSIKYYDHVFCYRKKNVDDLNNIGYNNTSLLLPCYIKENNFKIQNTNSQNKFQIVFIGHFEDDGRDEFLKMIIEKKYKLGLFGTGWENSKYYSFFIENLGTINRLDSESYNETLNNSKIALVFMSKLNNDEYTRRCFEIPATGSVMVSERMPALMKIFKENEEIIFFNNTNDFLSKIETLLNNPTEIEKISINALLKLKNGKHELTDRINEIIKIYFNIIKR
jgi:spore maturation protein CgeB